MLPKGIIEKVDKMRSSAFRAGYIACGSGKYPTLAIAMKAYAMKTDESDKEEDIKRG